jgi:hypothetical protein
MHHSAPIPEIETERLRLRAWRDGDIIPMTAINSDPAVRVGLLHHDDWVASEHDAEIGWTLSSSVWGNGYAIELSAAA